MSPFFLSEYVFADQDEAGAAKSTVDNIKDWFNYLGGSPTLDHIEKLVYKSKLEDLQKVKQYIEGGNASLLPKELKNNSMVKHLKEAKKSDIINYIIYAKECEPEVNYAEPWEEVKRNYNRMDSLLSIGINLQASEKSEFLKDRYSYQCIRLAHYSKKYDKTIELFDKYFSAANKTGMIYYWSLAHKAGALSSLNKKAEANLIFAKVFDSCPSRKKQCMLSINLSSDSLYNATLALCRQSSEKTLIYMIGGYKNSAYSIESMKKIYELDPGSPYNELLLSREIHKLERELLPTREIWVGHKYYLEPKELQNPSTGTALYTTAVQIAKENKSRKPWLWNFAAGYIATLLNKSDEAKDFYQAAKLTCPKENLSYIRRIQIAEIVAEIKSFNKLDGSNEDELTEKLAWLKNIEFNEKVVTKDAQIYVMNILARKYLAQRDTIKAHLCLGTRLYNSEPYYTDNPENAFGYNIRADYINEPIDGLLDILRENEKNRGWTKEKSTRKFSNIENFLLDNYSYSFRDLSMIKAKWLISKGNFKEALNMMEKANFYGKNSDNSEKLWADPFIIHVSDCHDCDYAAVNTNRYTVASFCVKMIEIKKLADLNNKQSAEYCYKYAVGLYNKSYYGNAWIASAFKRTSGPWGYYLGFHYDFYDCSEAQTYFLKAMKASSDREFAAKCLYMAAKCEQNNYYSSPAFTSEDPTPLNFRNNFRKMKDEYNDTQYYKEMLKECKYFNEFASKN